MSFFMISVLSVVGLRADETTRLLDDAMKRSEKTKVEIPKNVNSKGLKAAEKTDEYLKTKDFLNRLDEEKKKLKKSFGVQETPMESKINNTSLIAKSDRLYIFISSSVPRETLMAYIRDMDHLKEPNIILCLRGFVGGMRKVRPTLDFISSLVKKDPSCKSDRCEFYRANIDIDPLAFRYFDINRVPAVAFAENVNMENVEQSIGTPGNVKAKGRTNVIYGDMPLSYILTRMSATHPRLKKLVNKLERKGFYNGD